MNSDEIKTQITTENKQQSVYQQLRRDILNLTYPAGTIMVERKLCDIYGVSRSPIRNALQQLSHEGLLKYEPGKGVVVSSFTADDLIEVYELVEELHFYALKKFVPNVTPMIASTLTTANEHLKEAYKSKDAFQRSMWDHKFHELIIHYGNNSRMNDMYRLLDTQSKLFTSTVMGDPYLTSTSIKQHDAILNAILAGDVASACEAVHEHYEAVQRYYLNKLLNSPFT